MSLIGTLGKMAVGAIAAKGVGKFMGGKSGGAVASVIGGLLSSQQGNKQGGGMLANLLKSFTGGGKQQAGGSLASLLGGASEQQEGGLGGLLNSLGGGAKNQGGGGLGALLNSAIQGMAASQVESTPEQEKQAEILLRAMIGAAKADGEIDAEEQRKITGQLEDISGDDAAMVKREMQATPDLQGLIDSVPSGMGQQVYLMSLLAIDLDSKPEAQYLDKLAKGLNLSEQQCNTIHQKLGVPQLYS